MEEKMSHYLVSTVPEDGLAPLGARPSVGTVMITFGFLIYKGITLVFSYVFGCFSVFNQA